MAGAPTRSRTRALVALNLAALLWSIGLGAAVPVIPLLSYRFVPSAFAAALVTSVGGLGRLLISYFAGDMMDRFGKRRISLIGIFIRMTFSFLEAFPGPISSLWHSVSVRGWVRPSGARASRR